MEVEGLPVSKIRFAINRTAWWITDRFEYVMMEVEEGHLATLAGGRKRSQLEAPAGRVFIRLRGKAAKDVLAVPDQAQGFAFIGVPGTGWPGAWQFSRGTVSIEVTEGGHMVAAEVELTRAWPPRKVGDPPPDPRETLTLSTIAVASSDPGIPANLFTPRNRQILPELTTWIQEDPDLGQLVVPIR